MELREMATRTRAAYVVSVSTDGGWSELFTSHSPFEAVKRFQELTGDDIAPGELASDLAAGCTFERYAPKGPRRYRVEPVTPDRRSSADNVPPGVASLLTVLCNAQDDRRPVWIVVTNNNTLRCSYVHGFANGGETVRLGSRHEVAMHLDLAKIKRVHYISGGRPAATLWERT